MPDIYANWFVFHQPIIPVSKPKGNPETLSQDSRAPPESIVLTWRNTTGHVHSQISGFTT